jgi:hypothetical protein
VPDVAGALGSILLGQQVLISAGTGVGELLASGRNPLVRSAIAIQTVGERLGTACNWTTVASQRPAFSQMCTSHRAG